MARPTLSTHPKFLKLAARLKSRALARGVLEIIWESCYASGDAKLGDTEAVEATADWRGKAGILVAALTECGFIDKRGVDGAFEVHDLEHHAPNYVLKRWAAEAKRKEAGESIRSVRQKAAQERWNRQRAAGSQAATAPMHPDANVIQLHANGDGCNATETPPAPAPAPAPNPPDPPSALDPLTAHGLIRVVSIAVERLRPEIGFYQPGTWAAKRAREFTEGIAPERRTEESRSEIRRRVEAFARDERFKAKGWSVEAFCDAFNQLANAATTRVSGVERGARRIAAKVSSRYG